MDYGDFVKQMERIAEAPSRSFKRGDVVEGVLVKAAEGGWYVDFGHKTEGFIPQTEWTKSFILDDVEPKLGQRYRFLLVKLGKEEEDYPLLSRWRLVFEERWRELERALQEGDGVLRVTCVETVKGGMMVNCMGLRGFIPLSHLHAGNGMGSPKKLLGKELEVKVLELEKGRRNIKLSYRLVAEERRQKEVEEFLSRINEGDVLEGRVVSVTRFGVFVNLGPVDGLVPMSEVTYSRYLKPSSLVKKNQTVKVKVLSVDRSSGKVSLSIKRALPDPWEGISERYSPGSTVDGRVTGLAEFGAFVEIEPGVEGLIHISSLSWDKVSSPKEVLKIGQSVKVLIKDVNAAEKRISLGYRELFDPWDKVEEKYSVGQDVECVVKEVKDFGAFVEIEPGIEGLLHVSQMSTGRVSAPSSLVKEGDRLTCRILSIDKASRRIRLSRRAILEEELAERRRREEEERRRQQAEEEKLKASIVGEAPSVTLQDILKDKASRR